MTKYKTIGVTGHRALKHPEEQIKLKIKEMLLSFGPECVISGMAIGFDTLVAEVCIENNIELIAAVPHINQATRWNRDGQSRYITLLEKAKEIVVVCEGEYQTWMNFKRNEWIVDNSEMLISYIDPNEITGGSVHCREIAIKRGLIVENLF